MVSCDAYGFPPNVSVAIPDVGPFVCCADGTTTIPLAAASRDVAPYVPVDALARASFTQAPKCDVSDTAARHASVENSPPESGVARGPANQPCVQYLYSFADTVRVFCSLGVKSMRPNNWRFP